MSSDLSSTHIKIEGCNEPTISNTSDNVSNSNGYSFFMAEVRPLVEADHPSIDSVAIQRIVDDLWHRLSTERRADYEARANCGTKVKERANDEIQKPDWNSTQTQQILGKRPADNPSTSEMPVSRCPSGLSSSSSSVISLDNLESQIQQWLNGQDDQQGNEEDGDEIELVGEYRPPPKKILHEAPMPMAPDSNLITRNVASTSDEIPAELQDIPKTLLAACKQGNGFILFSVEQRANIRRAHPNQNATFEELSRTTASLWKQLSEEQKAQYKQRAMELREIARSKTQTDGHTGQNQLFAGRPSNGFLLFSIEQRQHAEGNCHFKTIAAQWSQLSVQEKEHYRKRATELKELQRKSLSDELTLQPGQVRVFSCGWTGCDFQFNTLNGLYSHIEHFHVLANFQYNMKIRCQWHPCQKKKLLNKGYLLRHIREHHLQHSMAIMQQEKWPYSKNYFMHISPSERERLSPHIKIGPNCENPKTHLFLNLPFGKCPSEPIAHNRPTIQGTFPQAFPTTTLLQPNNNSTDEEPAIIFEGITPHNPQQNSGNVASPLIDCCPTKNANSHNGLIQQSPNFTSGVINNNNHRQLPLPSSTNTPSPSSSSSPCPSSLSTGGCIVSAEGVQKRLRTIEINGTTVHIPIDANTVMLPPGTLGPEQTQQIIIHNNKAPPRPASATPSATVHKQHRQIPCHHNNHINQTSTEKVVVPSLQPVGDSSCSSSSSSWSINKATAPTKLLDYLQHKNKNNGYNVQANNNYGNHSAEHHAPATKDRDVLDNNESIVHNNEDYGGQNNKVKSEGQFPEPQRSVASINETATSNSNEKCPSRLVSSPSMSFSNSSSSSIGKMSTEKKIKAGVVEQPTSAVENCLPTVTTSLKQEMVVVDEDFESDSSTVVVNIDLTKVGIKLDTSLFKLSVARNDHHWTSPMSQLEQMVQMI